MICHLTQHTSEKTAAFQSGVPPDYRYFSLRLLRFTFASGDEAQASVFALVLVCVGCAVAVSLYNISLSLEGRTTRVHTCCTLYYRQAC